MASTTTLPLPSFAEWFQSDLWKAHLLDYDNHDRDVCPSCAVSFLMSDIYGVIMKGRPSHATLEAVWSNCDGYGPDPVGQGIPFDWSGIRDSSPAAVKAMWDAMQETLV